MKKIFLVSMILFCGTALYAQKTTVAQNRIARQQTRLNTGVSKGTVNPAEQARIQAQINNQQTQLANASANGKISKEERQNLIATQNKSSSHINNQRHDGKNPTPRKNKQ